VTMSILDTLRGIKNYDKQKIIAKEGAENERLSLAKNKNTSQEILFYLAQKDNSPAVRQAVVNNKSTPLHAAAILAIDSNDDVRLMLASRLVKLLPELARDKQSQLYAYAVQALGTLALDEVLKIKKALSSTLKDHAFAPPKVAMQLAMDMERDVSKPILRFCTVLSDKDLMAVLSDHPATWAAEAIAGRKTLSATLSRAIIQKGNAKAGTILLKNKGAVIDDTVLQEIITRAREFPEWHEPLATNHKLPPDMAKILSRYVDARLRKILTKKGGFDLQTTENVTDAVHRRIDMARRFEKDESVIDRVNAMLAQGRLNDQSIGDALALRDQDFVIAALACLSGASRTDVAKIMAMGAPKPICALCWKAKLSMRLAFEIQKQMAKIPHKELLYPKDGTDYPLSDKDMQWQLEFLGL